MKNRRNYKNLRKKRRKDIRISWNKLSNIRNDYSYSIIVFYLDLLAQIYSIFLSASESLSFPPIFWHPKLSYSSPLLGYTAFKSILLSQKQESLFLCALPPHLSHIPAFWNASSQVNFHSAEPQWPHSSSPPTYPENYHCQISVAPAFPSPEPTSHYSPLPLDIFTPSSLSPESIGYSSPLNFSSSVKYDPTISQAQYFPESKLNFLLQMSSWAEKASSPS